MKPSVEPAFDPNVTLSFDHIEHVRKQQQASQPWTEKYRPTTLSGVVGQTSVVDTVRGLMLGEHATFPHLILCGPAGTGKTTTMRAVAAEMYGKHAISVSGNDVPLSDMVLDINASDDRGIGMIRDHVSVFVSGQGSIMQSMGITVNQKKEKSMDSVSTPATTVKVEEKETLSSPKVSTNKKFLPKLIIMDEADNLTKNAMNALRSLIEKHADQVRFCFIVNYEHKMHDAISSRCLRLRFPPLHTDEVMLLLRRVCKAENIKLEQGALDAIVSVTGGDMRQTLNTLQSCAMHLQSSNRNGSDKCKALDATTVYRITGMPPPQQTATMLLQCFEHHDKLKDNVSRISSYLTHFGVSLKATIDAICAIVLKDPSNFKALGIAHEAALAHFLIALEQAQRRIVLVTDSGRMKLQVAALAAIIYRIKSQSGTPSPHVNK